MNDDSTNNIDEEKDVNKENEELYQNIIKHSEQKYDSYWDINNPVIKISLIVLFIVGVIGAIYYLIVWLTM